MRPPSRWSWPRGRCSRSLSRPRGSSPQRRSPSSSPHCATCGGASLGAWVAAAAGLAVAFATWPHRALVSAWDALRDARWCRRRSTAAFASLHGLVVVAALGLALVASLGVAARRPAVDRVRARCGRRLPRAPPRGPACRAPRRLALGSLLWATVVLTWTGRGARSSAPARRGARRGFGRSGRRGARARRLARRLARMGSLRARRGDDRRPLPVGRELLRDRLPRAADGGAPCACSGAGGVLAHVDARDLLGRSAGSRTSSRPTSAMHAGRLPADPLSDDAMPAPAPGSSRRSRSKGSRHPRSRRRRACAHRRPGARRRLGSSKAA
jgi:hypothetical protein